MNDLTHVDDAGRASMVDVTDKADTERVATAGATIRLQAATLALIAEGRAAKGDVIATARIAGIMAAKKTSELIPLCHPLMLTGVSVDIAPLDDGSGLGITASAKVKGPTGVEMEALTAASVAALTIYDMVKAVDREATIGDVRLLTKSGGKSGDYTRDEAAPASTPEAPKFVSRGFRRAPGANAAARPRALDMGPATPKSGTPRAEAFRTFLRESRLQVSSWAAQAGLPPGLVYGFLHGRVGRLPKDAEERLAKAANATVRDVFGSE
ncbi:MAG: cyclic pyranopterin monophosphate synthase MoaC [Alphaproteobacteria bacterium]|nr:cyclic pyranopterin monophosphate synthase MoaC [Alphaproteobacteria bacterium]